LIRVMVFSDAFNNVSVISWLRKLEVPRKTTTCRKLLTSFII